MHLDMIEDRKLKFHRSINESLRGCTLTFWEKVPWCGDIKIVIFLLASGKDLKLHRVMWNELSAYNIYRARV